MSYVRHVCSAIAVAVALGSAVGCERQRVERVEWTVMDTVAAVQWKTGPSVDSKRLVATAKGVFEKIETLLNAFEPTSELSRLAKLGDAEVLAKCDPLVRPCYEAAFRLRDETGGVFNPRWRGPDTLDLGAIAKGYAVDLAAAELAKICGSTEVLIDLGGNLKVVTGTWMTGVADPVEASQTSQTSPPQKNPQTSQTPQTFELASHMACATSAQYFRGAHIKDGRDGSDVTGTIVSVTVVDPASAMMADGLSTVMFLLGREKGEVFLKDRHPAARAIWIK